jgi:UDP-N-acetylglucosamine 2-epimerase (non-hydrolysing)
MKLKHILHVVGARPNFVKVAPVMAALDSRRVRQTLIHTGQHYDVNMSEAILRELGVKRPDVNLGVGSGSHAVQTGEVMRRMTECLVERKPDLVLVYGAVNSTLGATLAAAKLGIDVAHVEAGLRSGNRRTPEDINRMVTDGLSSWLFTPSEDADEHLRDEGADPAAIKLVGNVTIDTLVRLLPSTHSEPMMQMLGLMNGRGPRPFALVTLHRSFNVDDPARLDPLMDALTEIAGDLPVVFPVHPRTRSRMKDHHLKFSGVLVTAPLTYLQFLGLQQHATVVITDSGAVQEETTYLGVPCVTVRDSTERLVTTLVGTNVLAGTDPRSVIKHARSVLAGKGRRGAVPPLWDGHAAERIADHLAN